MFSSLYRGPSNFKCFRETYLILKRHKTQAKIRVSPYHLHKLEVGPEEEVVVTREDGLKMYQQMQTIRYMEEVSSELYQDQYIRGFCHLYLGQEACCVGLRMAMRAKDSLITAYRCHGWAFVMGLSVHSILSEMTGRVTGCVRAKGGSMHMYGEHFYGGNGIIGAHVPVGTGIAFAHKFRGEDAMCFTCYGDGAANQGQVFESFNISKLWSLPIAYVCENNLYAMGTASTRSTANPHYYTRCDYIPGIWVDGMDVLAVRQAGRFATKWCTSGKGPLIFELHTYRYSGHSAAEPGVSYRSYQEVKAVQSSRDPIEMFRVNLIANSLASEQQLKEIDTKVKCCVDLAASKSIEDPEPDPEEVAADLEINPVHKYMRGVGPWDKIEMKRINEPVVPL